MIKSLPNSNAHTEFVFDIENYRHVIKMFLCAIFARILWRSRAMRWTRYRLSYYTVKQQKKEKAKSSRVAKAIKDLLINHIQCPFTRATRSKKKESQ